MSNKVYIAIIAVLLGAVGIMAYNLNKKDKEIVYISQEYANLDTERQDLAVELEGMKFLDMSAAKKTDTLKQVEQKAKEQMKAYNAQTIKFGDNQDLESMNAVKMGLPFWRLMKELTLLGYYTSEGGTKASFQYVPNPGKFELTKLKPGQKTIVY